MNKLYLHNAASISAQGFTVGFAPFSFYKNVASFLAQQPNYKEMLPGSMARRMAKITKMATMCGLTLAQNHQLDGVIVGTGLGNLADTEKFLRTYNLSNGGLIPPTSFTQSSHNTLAGQIALLIKNHGYNMTHVQREFSFENALIDAQLQVNNGLQNVLVGAADEQISFLQTAAEQLGLPQSMRAKFGDGATFFSASTKPSHLVVQRVSVLRNAASNAVQQFLRDENIDQNKVYTASCTALGNSTKGTHVDVTLLAGRFFTNAAFATHIVANQLTNNHSHTHGLVINTNHLGDVGLILLRSA